MDPKDKARGSESGLGWGKITPGIGPQSLAHVSICQGNPFWRPIFDPQLLFLVLLIKEACVNLEGIFGGCFRVPRHTPMECIGTKKYEHDDAHDESAWSLDVHAFMA